MKNINYSYALSDEDVCGQVDDTTLVTREDSSTGPYIVCSNAHLNAIDVDEPGLLTDSYVLYQDIDLAGSGSDSIGGPCEDMSNAFTGSFDGKEKTISNINVGFNSDKSVYAKEKKKLFSCSNKVQNTNFSYISISEEQVCGRINDAELVREGSLAGPYIVCSRAHLNAIDDSDENLAADYVLYQDINLGTATQGGDGGADGKNFDPIGGSFTGTFDGQGKEIMNLTIRVNGDAGLFLKLGAGGTIQNLGINNFNVTTTSASAKVGTLAAEVIGGRIVDCYAVDSDNETDVSSSTGNNSVGGLVGFQNEGSITDSYAAGDVNGGASNNDDVGGLVGRQQGGGLIISSYATGDVNGGRGADSVGGLVGYQNEGSITDSYAAGDVNGGEDEGRVFSEDIGGLVGRQQIGLIISSYATGTVTAGNIGNDNVGGLVGRQEKGTLIISSYAAGGVNGGMGGSDAVGGLVGGQKGGSIISSYAEGDVNGGGGDSDFVGGLVGFQSASSSTSSDGMTMVIGGSAISSYAAGDVNGGAGNNDNVGGLVGFQNASSSTKSDGLGGMVTVVIGSSAISSYAAGDVNGGEDDNDRVGRLVGRQSVWL